MKRPLQASLFVLAAALGASGVSAAESSPILKDPAPPASPDPAVRAISAEAAGKLAAALPKYTSPPAVPTAATPATAELALAPDLRETDKPRNGIIRLPSYIVQEEKVPALKERDVLTPKGRLDLAMKRHPGLRIGNLFGLNSGWALAMLEEEERLERQREIYDLVTLLPTADAKKAKAMADDQFARKQFTGAR